MYIYEQDRKGERVSYTNFIVALCVWREARGEHVPAQLGVLWTIYNRSKTSAWWNGNKPNDPVAVVLMPKQYSSFNPGDPNSVKFPAMVDAAWLDIVDMVEAPSPDPTSGATHYYSTDIAAPDWAEHMSCTASIGAFKFYR